MSASSNKQSGWMEELKKSASKKNIFENIEKDRFLSSPIHKKQEIPEIEDFEIIDEDNSEISAPNKSSFKKEINIDILKNTSVNLDKIDLTVLIEALEDETGADDDEKDEVWNWNQLFTKVTAGIADEK